MPKLTTSDLTSLTNETSAVTTINNNFAAVETAMENTLSRDGTTPNTMSADIDLNGNDLLNIGTYSFSGGSTLAATVGYAEEWANKAEDSLVTVAAGGNGTTEYSALHWAAKAALDATSTAADVVSTNADAVSTAADVVSAAASAASAASVLEDIIFNDVVYLTSASSPYTLATTQSGVLLAIDTSGGAVTVNLPSIASAGDGWRISAKKTTGDANFVTFARNGTDTIDGNTSDTITTVGQSKTYVADTDGTPDDWTSVNFGSTLGRTWTDFTYTASGGETSVTGADDDGVVLAYQAGQVKVYLEGLLLDDSDYTATTGTSITGLAALVAGQTLYIETWDNVMSLGTMAAQDANAVAITGGTLASITSINAVTPATAQYTTALDTKLGGIEALADVTDATNVTAAGALMDSELTSIASVKALNQGVATTDTPTFAGIITSGNVDGRDVSVDGTKLDGIEAAADVTDATNVTAAGALMDSELTDIAAVKALDQGVATTDSPTFVNVTATDLDGILGSNTPAAVNGTTGSFSNNITAGSGSAGNHIFTTTDGQGIQITGAGPQFTLLETGVTADNGYWGLWATGEQLVGRIINDAASAASNWLVVDRTGTTVDNVTFPGTATTVSGTLSAGLLLLRR
jgi:trimeric autotransporter adhesin